MKMKFFFILSYFVLLCFSSSSATDSIKPNQNLTDNGDTLISAGETFELGFFSPSNSNKNRYVGISYKKVSQQTVFWVANRDNPVTNSSGVLTITPTGNIEILNNATGNLIWSSNSSAKDPILQLLNTGNLVVKDGANGNYIWESFDHPSDTLIPGMKLGWNIKTGQDWLLRSWRSTEDPSSGNFTYEVDPRGLPQLLQRRGTEIQYRSGPWDGVRFGGDPPFQANSLYNPIFVFNTTHVYYSYELIDFNTITRFMVNPMGTIEQLRWSQERMEWVQVFALQKDECDQFGHCGPIGICTVNGNPVCRCPSGFVPKEPQDWARYDWSDGCVPKMKVNCSVDKGFKKFSGFKLPYSSKFLVDRMVVSKKDCEEVCSRNCSCVAFAISGVSGCMLWSDYNLLDMREYSIGGIDLYVRLPASELGNTNKDDGKRMAVVIAVSVISGLLLFLSIGGYVIWKRKANSDISQEMTIINPNQDREDPSVREEDVDLATFGLDTIVNSTNNFSHTNKIGEGGFSPVYKGVLPTGEEIAVKRLSKDSGQGHVEFKNEVILIAKLQHRNLVRLLGCCIYREDRMLIYEYLPNKSLDLHIFNQNKSTALNWQKRFDIILGIARGLLYLHRDSRLRIIHRDLKASNILLDDEMNPKISDFGLARIFGGDQTEVNTSRIVGTYGYMAPEYAIDGQFSMKSDVFSFGVLVLEIVSGKKNRGFDHPDHDLNLLGHAWKLWNEGRPMELMDVAMENVPASEVLRCIQVGLLCVQKRPDERPFMSSALFMLDSENPSLSQPKQPGFYMERVPAETDSSSSLNKPFSSTQLSVTMFQGR